MNEGLDSGDSPMIVLCRKLNMRSKATRLRKSANIQPPLANRQTPLRKFSKWPRPPPPPPP